MTRPVITPHVGATPLYPATVALFHPFPPTPYKSDNTRNFIYTLVHEIRNPLTNINLAVDELRQADKPEDQEMLFNIISRNSERINEMVNDLLKRGSRLNNGPEKHSVKQLLEDVLNTNRDRIALKEVLLTRHYSQNDFKIKMDRAGLLIAITNIIINAIEAMPTEGAQLDITTKQLNRVCFIIIKDNGCGMSKENMNSLFEPYFTSKPGGIGLGMTGTLSILYSNNISIHVRSALKRGTRFILSCKKDNREA